MNKNPETPDVALIVNVVVLVVTTAVHEEAPYTNGVLVNAVG